MLLDKGAREMWERIVGMAHRSSSSGSSKLPRQIFGRNIHPHPFGL